MDYVEYYNYLIAPFQRNWNVWTSKTVLSSFDNTNVLSVRCKKILRCDFKLCIAEIFAAREDIPEHFHKSNNRTIFK